MKIFLSSTYQDLIGHREKAAGAIERLGQQGVRMEVFGARPLEATGACLQEISDSDALIGIYAHRYGHVPAGQSKSITEQEFEFAQEQKKPTFCFVVDEEYPWPPKHVELEPGRMRLQEFLRRLRETVVTDSFTTPEDLAFKVASSLGRFLLYRKVKDELEKIPARESVSTESGRSQVARRAARIEAVIRGGRLLLVNDIPEEMSHVAEILRDLGLDVHVETSSEDALRALSSATYHVVISDMQRGAVEDEGIRFLNRMREQGILIPVIFTVGRFDPALGIPPFAFGITNRVDECLNLVFDVLERTRG
jgi:CheY-like chemotaxis protein